MNNTEYTSSLTSKNDHTGIYRDLNNEVKLNDEQINNAIKELHMDMSNKYPVFDKYYRDPLYKSQVYVLTSFVPSKDAIPDKEGVFGILKIRGVFPNLNKCKKRTRYLLSEVDSYHKYRTSLVGNPIPICLNDKKYVQETKEIDIKKKIVNVTSEEIKKQREYEKKEMKDMKEREKNMLKQSDKVKQGEHVPEYNTDEDKYTMLKVKKAQLIFTYLETKNKMKQMKNSIVEAEKEIADMDQQDSSLVSKYKQRYLDAADKVNIPEDDESFMKYLNEDLVIDLNDGI